MNTIIGGTLEGKRKQRKVVLVNIFPKNKFGPFTLSIFQAGDSNRKCVDERGMMREWPCSLKEQTKNDYIKNKIYYGVTH